jgi:hypothetical protein
MDIVKSAIKIVLNSLLNQLQEVMDILMGGLLLIQFLTQNMEKLLGCLYASLMVMENMVYGLLQYVLLGELLLVEEVEEALIKEEMENLEHLKVEYLKDRIQNLKDLLEVVILFLFLQDGMMVYLKD